MTPRCVLLCSGVVGVNDEGRGGFHSITTQNFQIVIFFCIGLCPIPFLETWKPDSHTIRFLHILGTDFLTEISSALSGSEINKRP